MGGRVNVNVLLINDEGTYADDFILSISNAAGTESYFTDGSNWSTGSAPKIIKLDGKRVGNDPINVRDYGAVGDGTTDDNSAVQSALAAAAGGKLWFPPGTYMITEAMEPDDDTTITGDGWQSIICNDPTQATEFNSCVVDGKSNVTISNLLFDGRVDERSGTDDPKGGIFLDHGCQNCVVDSVCLRDYGHHTTAGGNYITIDVTESSSRNSTGNRVSNCRIEDSGTGKFGIRVTTEWDVDVADSAYTRFCRDNVIENNVIIGCTWNAIEIAGPATIYNRIVGNQSIGCTGPGGIEADKGSSWNRFSDNSVVDAVPNASGNFAAFRDQGFTGGSFYDRYSRGNVWVNSVVRGCTQESSQSFAGFQSDYSIGCTVTNLVVEDNTPDVPATYADMYGLHVYDATNMRVSNALIRDVLDPVLVNQDVTGLDLSQCDMRAFTGAYCVRITDDLNSLSVTGCRLDGGSNGIGLSANSTSITGGLIAGNHFFNHSYAGIKLDGTSTTLLGLIDGNYFDATLGSACVKASDWSTFTFQGNYYTDGNSPGAEARAFISNNLRVGGTNVEGNRASSWDDAAPTAGAWVKGDIVWNNDPSAGGNIGWVCTEGGSPGTWNSFGAIAS